MQIVCAVPGGIEAYDADNAILIAPETLQCQFCSNGHRLRRNGTYERYVLLPDPHVPKRIAIQRLLCARTGRTVSLLPDFCLPRRQHGPAILGRFLEGWLLRGLTLLKALRDVRADAPGHSMAQALRDGFERRERAITVYLGARRAKHAAKPSGAYGALTALTRRLLHGFDEAGHAFVHHGRNFYATAALGLG